MMKLIPLRCHRCQEPLAAGETDLIVRCPHCLAHAALTDAGILAQSVAYAQPAAEAPLAGDWFPCWRFTGQVTLTQRLSQDRQEQDSAAAFKLWKHPRTFLIPAWDLPMKDVRRIGSQLVQQPPHLEPLPQAPPGALAPVVITAAEAGKMAEFIVLDIEARRPDKLKSLSFRLDFDPPALWALAEAHLRPLPRR